MADVFDEIRASIARLSESTMNAKDIVQGSMGQALMIVAGVPIKLGNLVKYEAKDKNNASKHGILGCVSKGTKMNSVEGTYNAEIYFNSSAILKYQNIFRHTGYAPPLAFYIANEDPTSAAGRNSGVYMGCTMEGCVTGILDVDADALKQSIEGSYDDWIPIESFNDIPGVGVGLA